MNWWQTFLTDAGVVVAIIGLIGLLAKALIDFHASRPAAEKISVDTFADMRGQIDKMEDKIIQLRERVEILENLIDTKEAAIKQKDADIAQLQEQVNKLDTRLNRVLFYVSGLLRELNEKGVQYTPPDPGVLDTDPRIPAVIKKGAK